MWKVRALIFFVGALIAVAAFKVRADQWPEWNPENSLKVAQCIAAEDSFRDWKAPRESAALAHILVKRWRWRGGDFGEFVESYCALWDPRSPRYYEARREAIRNATFIAPPPGKAWEKRWPALRRFVAKFQKRQVPDPHPEATNWGSEDDRRRWDERGVSYRVVAVYGRRLKQYIFQEAR